MLRGPFLRELLVHEVVVRLVHLQLADVHLQQALGAVREPGVSNSIHAADVRDRPLGAPAPDGGLDRARGDGGKPSLEAHRSRPRLGGDRFTVSDLRQRVLPGRASYR